jgi:UDP-N-acetylglucosamine 3-dehydrogenase
LPDDRRVKPERVRFALIGLGTMGRNHLRVLMQRPDVEVVAVADPDRTSRERAVAASGARGYDDVGPLFSEERVDAAIVAAPTTMHRSAGRAALEAGVPLFVEKPLAGTVAEARELVDLAQANGVPLQVGHVERFNPAVTALGERLAGGALSRTFSIKTLRAGPLPERIRDVGVAVDLATHDVDIICHLAGARPERVYAEITQQVHTTHEDLLFALLRFRDGLVGLLDVNWLTPEKQRRLVVLGEEGMFQVDYLTQRLTFTRGQADLDPAKWMYLGGYAPTFPGATIELPVEPAEPLVRQLDAFVSTVRDGVPPAVSGEEGMWAVRLADMLLESAASGRAIDLQPSGSPT